MVMPDVTVAGKRYAENACRWRHHRPERFSPADPFQVKTETVNLNTGGEHRLSRRSSTVMEESVSTQLAGGKQAISMTTLEGVNGISSC